MSAARCVTAVAALIGVGADGHSQRAHAEWAPSAEDVELRIHMASPTWPPRFLVNLLFGEFLCRTRDGGNAAYHAKNKLLLGVWLPRGQEGPPDR